MGSGETKRNSTLVERSLKLFWIWESHQIELPMRACEHVGISYGVRY